MKTTRRLSLVLALLCAAAALWAAGGAEGAAAAGGPASVTYTQFSGSGDNLKYLNQMLEAFQKMNPNVKVTIETIGYGEYFTQMQTRVAAGTAPDAYELNYENFVTYAKKGVLMDMNPLFKAAKFDKATLDGNALAAFNADGKQYGLPASFSDVLLFYNKELFDKAKVAYPTDAWTWKEELAAAQKIRALDEKTFGIFQPIQFWELYKMVQQNGGSILNNDKTKFTLNTPQNVETLQFMVDRVNKYNVTPTEAQLAGMGDWDLFKSGRLGMIVTGIWAFPDFIRDCTFSWDVAVEPGNTKKATHFFANGIVLKQDGKNAAAAFEWVRFMSASREAAKIRVDAGWELPASTYPDVLDAYLKITPPANRKAVFASLKYLVTPPVIEGFNQMTDLIGVQLQAARDGVKTPGQALSDAQKELEEKIKL
jgi:multiple sugar transport system substrate-binding protein